MNYVNTIRRIIAIDNGISRIINRDDERCDSIWDKLEDKLEDKRDALVKSIKDYIKCPDRTNKELRHRTVIRGKQVRLACRYLNVDYYRVIR